MTRNRFFNPQEVALVLGISKQTLLRYEKRGILPSPKRNLVNGWREYTEVDVSKMQKILGRI